MKKLLINNKIGLLILGILLGILLILVEWYGHLQESPQMDRSSEKESSQISGSETENVLESGTDTQEDTQGDTEPDTPVVTLNENPLTGEFNLTDGAVGKRPVAVMVNNVSKAMPQYGVAQADIIFEIPVEGFLTRFMAIYADYTQMPKICSVRSCRKYFPAIAEGFDAVYVYSGMSSAIRDYVNSLDLTVFEGGKNHGGLFARDEDRRKAGYALEHTLYFDGTGIVAAMEKRKLRSDIEADKKGNAFQFTDAENPVKPEGDVCTSVKIDFGAAKATLTYDAATGTYLKDFNGNPQIDGVTGTQLAFTNVFVLETTIKTDENGTHKDVDWHGGTGYYISNGTVQQITWSKKDEESPLKFYNANGKELLLNRGKSYIAINRKNRTEFTGQVQ